MAKSSAHNLYMRYVLWPTENGKKSKRYTNNEKGGIMFPRFKNTGFSVKVSKNALLKIVLIFGSIFGVFLMTGLLYFRNDVQIIDENEKRTVYTVSADPYEILRENNIKIGAYDKIEFSGFDSSVTATLKIDRAFEVPVTVDGKETATAYNVDLTTAQLLEQAGIEYGEYDTIVPALDEVVKEGEKITVTRAFDVSITADGKTHTVKCLDNTVSELLERAGVTVDNDDMVSEELGAVISEPCEIKVSRVEIKTKSVDKVIPYQTSTVTTNILAIGDSEVRTEGVDGRIRTTTTTTYIDGVKTDVKKETTVVTEKVDEVIAEGAAVVTPYCKIDDTSIVLENGRPIDYEYIVSGKATAYTAREGARTASGRLAEIGTCAVNPNVIPYGSKLYIVGQNDNICYGYAIAADTGDGMMDGSIPVDVYMGSTSEHYADACAWGLQYVDIYVIEVGNG